MGLSEIEYLDLIDLAGCDFELVLSRIAQNELAFSLTSYVDVLIDYAAIRSLDQKVEIAGSPVALAGIPENSPLGSDDCDGQGCDCLALGLAYNLPSRTRASRDGGQRDRSEEHTSELQSRGLISYAVFCL